MPESKETKGNVGFETDSKSSELWKLLKTYFVEIVESNAPSGAVLGLPSNYVLVVTIIVNILLFIVLIYLFLSGLEKELKSKFLSLTTDSGVCSSVLKVTTTTVGADANGAWEGQQSFSQSLLIYDMKLVHFEASDEAYVKLMTLAQKALYNLSAVAEHLNLASNLMVWSTWLIAANELGYLQTFSIAGDATTIYTRRFQRGNVGSVHGYCRASSIGSFDTATGKLALTYSYDEYSSDELCMLAGVPQVLGYNSQFNGDNFVLNFDVRSLMLAAAVNSGLVFVQNLVHIAVLDDVLFVNGIPYDVKRYYLDRYPGMSPIICISSQNSSYAPSCGLFMNEFVYAYPLLEHFGAQEQYPDICECTSSVGNSEACNEFNLLSGVMFYVNETDYMLDPFFEVVNSYGPVLSQEAYYALFGTATVNNFVNQSAIEYVNSTEYILNAFQFCRTSSANCSVLSLNSYDGESVTFNKNYAVNKYFYELLNGSCTSNDFLIDNFRSLIDTPPVPLTESYFECQSTSSTAALNALGIAVGNAGALAPVITVLLVTITVYYAKKKGLLSELRYEKRERESYLDVFAAQLLMFRDGNVGKLRTEDSLLAQITSELKSNYLKSPEVRSIAWQSAVHRMTTTLKIEDEDFIVNSGDLARASSVSERGTNSGVQMRNMSKKGTHALDVEASPMHSVGSASNITPMRKIAMLEDNLRALSAQVAGLVAKSTTLDEELAKTKTENTSLKKKLNRLASDKDIDSDDGA